MSKFFLVLLLPVYSFAQSFTKNEITNWQQQANQVTIIRDNWGVPHIYGTSDADVVFGLMYAQCEDNYWQLEESGIRALGRAAEIYGEKELQSDAGVALFECVNKGKEAYAKADIFLKKLCDAAAAGINFYLHKQPDLEKRLLHKYEPWFFLMPYPLNPTSHGITQMEIKNAFAQSFTMQLKNPDEQLLQKESGSNTIALSPKKTKSGHSILLINPHVNFFGGGQRYEAHLISKQGLNVSGFAMFGKFYIWSGFNQYAGWAHTNTHSDFEDVYLESFNHPSDSTQYKYGDGYRKAVLWNDTLLYKTDNGLKKKVFVFRKTHHGPVTALRDSLWVTIKDASSNSAKYILQAWLMCKAKNLKEFTAAMSNVQLTTNTMYADRFGNITYWHGNAIPKRNENFDWRYPVNGSNPQTEWEGIHPLKDIVQIVNPSSRWIQNCNATPYKSAGISSPKKENYPAYMAYEEQNYRSQEVIRLLSQPGKVSFTEFEKLVTSTHLPMMAEWLPQIISAYDNEVKRQPEKNSILGKVIDTLRNWDYRYSTSSKATTLAVFWYRSYSDWVRPKIKTNLPGAYLTNLMFGKNLPAPDSTAVQILHSTIDTLKKKYGTEFISWGEINRLQRIHTSGNLEKFDDKKVSLPVGAVPSSMGSLFAFQTRIDAGQKNLYGVGGNSYVAVIEFGEKVKAKSVVYFGQSADPASPHYFDQAPLYAAGKFKEAYFYKEDVLKHAERKYHPGE
jgi:penicillin amidase